MSWTHDPNGAPRAWIATALVLFFGAVALLFSQCAATGSVDKTVCSRITPEGRILYYECAQ